jgi:hypothetical protein
MDANCTDQVCDIPADGQATECLCPALRASLQSVHGLCGLRRIWVRRGRTSLVRVVIALLFPNASPLLPPFDLTCRLRTT